MIRDRSPIREVNEDDYSSDNENFTFNSRNLPIIPNLNMTELSNVEFQMAKEMIPEYSGGSKNLAYFIKQSERFIELLKKPHEFVLFNKLLLEQIKSKLKGEARDVLISGCFETWPEIKDALMSKFGDPRSEELLLNDLSTCYQRHNENYETYWENIRYKLQVLLEHVNIREINRDIKINKQNMYTQQALTTFKSGILEPYCTHLLNVNPINLEAALHECRKFDNEKAQISFMNFMRNRGKPSNNTPIKKPINLPRHHNFANNSYPNYNFLPKTNQNISRPIQTQTTPFPRGPININQSKPTPPSENRPSSSGTFSRKPEYKPTPMSISTRNTYRPQYNQNHFKPQSRPTFIAEEIYNVENENYDQDYGQNVYYQNENISENNSSENFQIPGPSQEST